jgi:hypothetical protein
LKQRESRRYLGFGAAVRHLKEDFCEIGHGRRTGFDNPASGHHAMPRKTLNRRPVGADYEGTVQPER